jgi:chromosome segregation ATPase
VSEPNADHSKESSDQPSDRSDASEISASSNELESQLDQMQAKIRNQIERIQDLELALDQSISNLNELRLQIVNQQFLEEHLASTEEIANVQQQAINQLKRQFAEKQAAFEQQIHQAQEREQDYQKLLEAAELFAQSQHAELQRLRTQVTLDRSDALDQTRLTSQIDELQVAMQTQQQQVLELESQELTARSLAANLELQLQEAQKQIRRLYRELNDRHTAINELEARLGGDFSEQPLNSSASSHSDTQNSLQKVEELESQLVKQMATQALLQQACQELELDREQSQTRIAELERQAAEMQEQILSQAQQASEYETAVQHWKDRFYTTQDKVAQLKDLLENGSSEPSPELAEIFAAIQATSTIGSEPLRSNGRADAFNEDLKIDLPDFLTRRRTYRNRS